LISDNDLMCQVKAGETVKLGLLYERHKKALLGYFYKVTLGDQQASEDLVHNTFFRVLKYSYNFKGEGLFITWLFSIAHNIGQDYHKKKRNTVYIENPNISIEINRSTSDEIIKQEEQKMLRKALYDLKSDEREVLILGKIKNLSYKEVGEILDCSEGAVKVKIHRALSSLRKVYLELAK
jgi:RNA polymerase sigma factor (sigma-70 family)